MLKLASIISLFKRQGDWKALIGRCSHDPREDANGCEYHTETMIVGSVQRDGPQRSSGGKVNR